MTHTRRKKSETGYYHVVSKGDGGQLLFEDDADKLRYLAELESALDATKVRVHAYCLMSNHVHLILEDRDDELGAFMKTLNERYAMYFGKKTGRVGHVFQGRFWSEPIDRDEYLLAAVRYVHANPEPAGMCSASAYKWSSYGAYAGHRDGKGGNSFVETGTVLEMLGGVDAFKHFQEGGGRYSKAFATSSLSRHHTYEELGRIAEALIGKGTLAKLKAMPLQNRADYLRSLSDAGFTDAQISRLTGIGQTSIKRSLC